MNLLLIGGVVVAVLAVFYLVGSYNGMVRGRNRVQGAWSQIDVQLKRRADLIPNLVEAVRAYMQHERATLERLVRARAEALAAGDEVTRRAAAEGEVGRSMRTLFAVAEAYPQLRAGENMRALQEELTSTENRIAFARQFYNDAVTEYNGAVQSLPAAIYAGAFGFSPAAFFTPDDPAITAPPRVSLERPT
jgi:LemA protein